MGIPVATFLLVISYSYGAYCLENFKGPTDGFLTETTNILRIETKNLLTFEKRTYR